MQRHPGPPHGHVIQSDPYFTLMADEHGDGFVHWGDGVLVVPLTEEGDVLMAMECSPAFDREVLSLVGGEVEGGEPREQTANRELQEELGWRAGRIDFLGEVHPFKYLASRCFIFLARGLKRSKLKGDEKHPINVRRVKLDGFYELCTCGELQDAPPTAGLCMAQKYLQQEVRS